MMNPGTLTIGDLVEEGKKRIVLLFIFIIGLSYLMSLTSSSVWVNMPAAAFVIFLVRYMMHENETRKKAGRNGKPQQSTHKSPKKLIEDRKPVADASEWRKKVDSPVVEAAIDQLTRHLVSEWFTDLWYSRLTPDQDAPEELVRMINNFIGDISARARGVNIIDLLTRDVVSLFRDHLELYRASQAKVEAQIGKHILEKLDMDKRDEQLTLVLEEEGKLHPAIKAEHKVLQKLISELMAVTMNQEDLQCNFFRYITTELLVCAVMRPVLNLASPRFINERIEAVVLSISNKTDKTMKTSASENQATKQTLPTKLSIDRLSGSHDPSASGVELVQFKTSKLQAVSEMKRGAGALVIGNDGHSLGQVKLSSTEFQSKDIRKEHGAEWGQMLDVMSRRKTQALAPEHFDNMWTKGRNYKKKENENLSSSQSSIPPHSTHSSIGDQSRRVLTSKPLVNGNVRSDITIYTQQYEESAKNSPSNSADAKHLTFGAAYREKVEDNLGYSEDAELENYSSSCSSDSEDDDSTGVTGLDSPGTKVWDSKSGRRDGVSHIRHPLESSDAYFHKKSSKVQLHRPVHTVTTKKRSAIGKSDIWKEIGRTSFSLGDGRDILNIEADTKKKNDTVDDENWERIFSGAGASSSVSSVSLESDSLSHKLYDNTKVLDSLFKMRCEVLGAHVVRSGSKTFAVYSISVTEAINNTWMIKRRYRHFEELHRRLKEFSEYNLSLPPKHFLSSGLDSTVVQERCKLLDLYLKNLLHLPNISQSIEVWDFLCVDSQTYTFSNSLFIIETFPVDLDNKFHENAGKERSRLLPSVRESPNGIGREAAARSGYLSLDDSRFKAWHSEVVSAKDVGKTSVTAFTAQLDSDSDSDIHRNSPGNSMSASKSLDASVGLPSRSSQSLVEAASDLTVPAEWEPPNLSVPILDLVDVIFQLQDGGWIRRQAFWVAKQVLQLGMGDALDDWLIDKIQLLRKGAVIASGVTRLEQILWPEGIFISKHPKHRREGVSQSSNAEPKDSSKTEGIEKVGIRLSEQQQRDAARRANFVRELMIDNAPAALVSLVGRKEYERCVLDVYNFLQSAVCLKQLAYSLLELLLQSMFPELGHAINLSFWKY